MPFIPVLQSTNSHQSASALLGGILLVVGCALISCDSHVDAAYKAKYSRNKMVLLALAIDQYRSQNGSLPEKIESVGVIMQHFLEEHQGIRTGYLCTCWTGSQVPACELAPGFLITYLRSPDGDHYFLAAPSSAGLQSRITYDYLVQSTNNNNFDRDIQYMISDSRFSFARYGAEPEGRHIDQKNYMDFLVKYTCQGHIVTW